mmetsp:Transcript_16078/g.24130  ORF Transcript_16078/g.24130 Transcript_16078/m.24130 type:complete len:634 (-) Transcript_16078:254-2155(-)
MNDGSLGKLAARGDVVKHSRGKYQQIQLLIAVFVFGLYGFAMVNKASTSSEYKNDKNEQVLGTSSSSTTINSQEMWGCEAYAEMSGIECEIWSSPTSSSTSSSRRQMNEYVIDIGAPSDFLPQVYAMWRYWLNGAIGEAAGLDMSPGILVTSRKITQDTTLHKILENGAIPAGSLVFFDVLGSIDTQVLPNRTSYSLQGDMSLGCGGADENDAESCKSKADQGYLDTTCAYLFAETDIGLRNSLYRSLLSYSKPLILVIAGDVGCRLRTPPTHHRIILANDGCLAQALDASAHAGKTVYAWPQGLESYTDIEAAASLADLVSQAKTKSANKRKILVSASFSYFFRKPSRINLMHYLSGTDDKGNLNAGALALQQVANTMNERTVSFFAQVVSGAAPEDAFQFGTMYPEDNTAALKSIFVICPAGDLWTSGRIIEAMLLRNIPVVDETYVTDGGRSAKGCRDPAKLFRDGFEQLIPGYATTSTAPAPAAPFAFVQAWEDLPNVLSQFDDLDAQLDKVSDYANQLGAYLRTIVLDYQPATDDSYLQGGTQCTETPLDEYELAEIFEKAQAYYANPDWFDSFVDSPSIPTNACTKEESYVSSGALCFSADCAPRLISDFTCSPILSSSMSEEEKKN